MSSPSFNYRQGTLFRTQLRGFAKCRQNWFVVKALTLLNAPGGISTEVRILERWPIRAALSFAGIRTLLTHGRRLDIAIHQCHIHIMTEPAMPAFAELEPALAVSEAQLAAGDLVSADEILAEEQAVLARLEANEQPRRRRGALFGL
jgi:hypothetical protein